ncbi:MAG: hypothetical protein AAGJ18_24855 [Bacteroidota bacterium]
MKEDNFEKFIRKSIEDFDRPPQDEVWDAIRTTLEAEVVVPFYRRANFWKYFGLCVLLIGVLGTGGYLWRFVSKMQQNNNTLLMQNQLLQQAIQRLEAETALASVADESSLSVPLSPNEAITKPLSKQVESPLNTKKLNQSGVPTKRNVDQRTSFFSDDFSSYRFGNTPFLDKNKWKYLAPTSNFKLLHTVDFRFAEDWGLAVSTSATNDSHNLNYMEATSNLSENLVEFSSRNKGVVPPLNTLTASLAYETSLEKIPSPTGKITPVHQLPRRELSIGVTTTAFSTYTDRNEFNFELGWGLGVEADYLLNRRFGLTAGVHYLNQTYSLSGTAANSVLPNYFGVLSDKPLSSLQVQNKVLSGQLGFRWTFPAQNGKNWFLHKAIAGLMHLPQQFTYDYLDAGTITLAEDRYFLYLGTIDTFLGKEFYQKRTKCQLGLYHSFTLTPLGTERRKLHLFGVKAAVKFIKK